MSWNFSYVFRIGHIPSLRSSPVWLRLIADSTLPRHLHDIFCKSGRKSQCKSLHLSQISLLWGIYGLVQYLVTLDIFASFSTCSRASTHFGNWLSWNAIRDWNEPRWIQYGSSHFRWFLKVWLDWLGVHNDIHSLQFQSSVWIFAPKMLFSAVCTHFFDNFSREIKVVNS